MKNEISKKKQFTPLKTVIPKIVKVLSKMDFNFPYIIVETIEDYPICKNCIYYKLLHNNPPCNKCIGTKRQFKVGAKSYFVKH